MTDASAGDVEMTQNNATDSSRLNKVQPDKGFTDAKIGKSNLSEADTKRLSKSSVAVEGIVCPKCNKTIKTIVKYQFTNQGLFFFILCLLIFFPLALCFLCADQNYNHQHLCPDCGHTLMRIDQDE